MAAEIVNDRYEVLEPLPSLDAAPFAVSKARDSRDGRVVTVSTLPVGLLASGSAPRLAFLAAARRAAQLTHPHIAAVYDEGEMARGDLFVITDYVRGISLRERIRRVAPFSLTVAAEIALATGESLRYAHEQGVPHGDLRPENILLSPEGQIKVGGFAYSREASLLVPGAERARLPYLPPEGERGGATVAGDLYALGAILFEMLTGVPPADTELVPSPQSLNASVPPALEGICQKALQPDPMRRYQTAVEMTADLQAVRDALRAGRPLNWSPLAPPAAKRAPRPAEPVPPLPDAAAVATPGVLTAAAQELEGQRSGKRTSVTPSVDDYDAPVTPERDPNRALAIASRLLFVVAVLGVIGLTWYLSKFLAIPNDVTVPSMVGKTFDDAQRIAHQQHFALTKGGEDYSPKWPEGQIYQQEPPEGHSIKAGQEVIVQVSLGPRLLQVPNLVKVLKDRAMRDLRDANLPLGTLSEEYSDSVAAGVIIKQSPEPGAMVSRNTAVNLSVSKGKQPPDAPTDVVANAPASDRVELTWKPTPRADSYTVVRSEDAGDITIAKNITETHFTDPNRKPDSSYVYKISATNSAGTSEPSDPALVSTPAIVVQPPVLDPSQISPPSDPSLTNPPDNATGGSGPSETSGDAASARMRPFTVTVDVPRRPRKDRRVQIEIQDVTGTSLVYDETKSPGEHLEVPLQGFGNKITFRIFIDTKLDHQETL